MEFRTVEVELLPAVFCYGDEENSRICTSALNKCQSDRDSHRIFVTVKVLNSYDSSLRNQTQKVMDVL